MLHTITRKVEALLKRIVFILLTIQFLIFGSSSAWAQSPTAQDKDVNVPKKTEETQNINVTVEQGQNVDTGGTADKIDQEQKTDTVQSQVQSTPDEEKSSGEADANAHSQLKDETTTDQEPANETTTDQKVANDTKVDQEPANETTTDQKVANDTKVDQEPADETTTDQKVANDTKVDREPANETTVGQEVTDGTNQTAANGSRKDSEDSELISEPAPQLNESYKHEQSVEVTAEQKQKVIEAEKVEADQEQDVTLEYGQSLKVTQKESQSQNTKIITEQDQSITTAHDTDYAEQTTETAIHTKQEGEINPEENRNTAKQQTEVTTTQKHEAETSGDAKIQQEQSVEAIAADKDTNSEKLSIKAKAENGLEIIKNAANTVVKIVQSIFINDKEIKDFEKEYVIKDDAINHSQEYSQTFTWGTLYVLNSVFVNTTADKDTYSLLDSVIRLEFFLPKNKPVYNDSSDDSSYDSDGDGLTNGEERRLGTDPYNRDTDGDRLSDYFEVRISKTNPLNRDTDGDGLSDYLEVKVHKIIHKSLIKA